MTAFEKKKAFLICVDSDGCAVDTMTSKHEQAFCPQLIRVFGLQAYAGLVTEFWLTYNLYRKTRGVNRFVGLAAALDFMAQQGVDTAERLPLHAWLQKTSSLSGETLRADGKAGRAQGMERILEWNDAVNQAIRGMKQKPVAYEGVAQALALCAQHADIAVVSSANHTAITQEWSHCGLLVHANVVMGQEAGTKAACIAALMEHGYRPEHVIMIGDALGDRQAAEKNGVLFFPVLPKQETESWNTWRTEGLEKFLKGEFSGVYAEKWRERQNALLP